MERSTFLKQIAMTAAFTGSLSLSGLAKELNDLTPSEARMPALFIGHGNPMNAILDNPFTRALHQLALDLPKPKAILCVSAHWLTRGTAVNASVRPRMIYDMYGFPEALYKVDYPSPGAPDMAAQVKAMITQAEVQLDEAWGYDHGCWMVLKLMYPEASIPVFQLSIDIEKPASYHYALAQELRALRDKGVLIIGSGNIVHNLRMVDMAGVDTQFDWALEYDTKVKNWLAAGDFQSVLAYEKAGRSAELAIPTPDHFYPLAYTLGVAHSQELISFPYEGLQHGSISMRCIRIG